MADIIHGGSNTNVGNVSNSYNNTINVGMDEESLRIKVWLSPLEPHKRHQDVRGCRLDGLGGVGSGSYGERSSSHGARVGMAR